MRAPLQHVCKRFKNMKTYAMRFQAQVTRTGRRSFPHVAERTAAQKAGRERSW